MLCRAVLKTKPCRTRPMFLFVKQRAVPLVSPSHLHGVAEVDAALSAFQLGSAAKVAAVVRPKVRDRIMDIENELEVVDLGDAASETKAITEMGQDGFMQRGEPAL